MMDSKNVGDEKLARKHDFDAAWKSILEAFEVEIVGASMVSNSC